MNSLLNTRFNISESCEICKYCHARRNSIFDCLDEQEIDFLMKEQTDLSYKYGDLIFKEKQTPSGIYIITKGKIKISKSGFEGREQIVRFAKEGDLIGYRSLLSNEKYTCSAFSISETNICFLSKELVFKLIEKNIQLAFRFINLLAIDVRISEEKMMHMAQKTVRERVAEAILVLKEIYGFEADGNTVNIALKRDEIAGIAGTVRETATRFLLELNSDNIISVEGKKIKILNLKKLELCANPNY